MEMRICSKCGEEKPATKEFFRSTKTKNGDWKIWYVCKSCLRKYQKQWVTSNEEHFKEYQKQWTVTNKESVKEYQKQWELSNKEHRGKYREDNKERIAMRNKKYRKINEDKLRAQRKEYCGINKEKVAQSKKIYRINNMEKSLETLRRYRKNNKVKIKEAHRKWRKGNPEKVSEYGRKRRTIRRKLSATLTSKQWEKCKEYFNYSCAYCGKSSPLERDHFIALTNNGEYSRDNIIPACRICNASKSNREFSVWYPKYRHYSKKREKKILDYLNYKNGVQQFSFI